MSDEDYDEGNETDISLEPRILNLTQHDATEDQLAQGVFEPRTEIKEKIKTLLTFETLPTTLMIDDVSSKLATLAEDEFIDHLVNLNQLSKDDYDENGLPSECEVMIGGAPFLMSSLESDLLARGLQPVYAFSKRVVKEVKKGKSVKKIEEFTHEGFVRI